MNIAHLNKAEWLNAYAKARPKAFTVVNINSSWAGAGLYPFQPRKVIRRIQSKTPSPPSTSPPPQNIFKNTLLSSLPSNIIDMHHANQAIKALFQDNSTLHTSE